MFQMDMRSLSQLGRQEAGIDQGNYVCSIKIATIPIKWVYDQLQKDLDSDLSKNVAFYSALILNLGQNVTFLLKSESAI